MASILGSIKIIIPKIIPLLLLLIPIQALSDTDLSTGLMSKYAILPVKVAAYELTAAGTLEKRPDWTEQASGHVNSAISEYMAGIKGEPSMRLDSPVPEIEKLIDEHIALYTLISQSRNATQQIRGWKAYNKKNPLSIGPGLSTLFPESIIDHAYIFSVQQARSTGARVALSFVAFVALGAIPAQGKTLFNGALIEVNSGEVLWNSNQILNKNITKKGDVNEMVNIGMRKLSKYLTEKEIKYNEDFQLDTAKTKDKYDNF